MNIVSEDERTKVNSNKSNPEILLALARVWLRREPVGRMMLRRADSATNLD